MSASAGVSLRTEFGNACTNFARSGVFDPVPGIAVEPLSPGFLELERLILPPVECEGDGWLKGCGEQPPTDGNYGELQHDGAGTGVGVGKAVGVGVCIGVGVGDCIGVVVGIRVAVGTAVTPAGIGVEVLLLAPEEVRSCSSSLVISVWQAPVSRAANSSRSGIQTVLDDTIGPPKGGSHMVTL